LRCHRLTWVRIMNLSGDHKTKKFLQASDKQLNRKCSCWQSFGIQAGSIRFTFLPRVTNSTIPITLLRYYPWYLNDVGGSNKITNRSDVASSEGQCQHDELNRTHHTPHILACEKSEFRPPIKPRHKAALER
jgi:hypothetical protein